jgi:hypothetical protein
LDSKPLPDFFPENLPPPVTIMFISSPGNVISQFQTVDLDIVPDIRRESCRRNGLTLLPLSKDSFAQTNTLFPIVSCQAFALPNFFQ